MTSWYSEVLPGTPGQRLLDEKRCESSVVSLLVSCRLPSAERLAEFATKLSSKKPKLGKKNRAIAGLMPIEPENRTSFSGNNHFRQSSWIKGRRQ